MNLGLWLGTQVVNVNQTLNAHDLGHQEAVSGMPDAP